MKLEARLRDAGLHNTDYARQIMSKVPPPQPPRRDMESTVFKKNLNNIWKKNYLQSLELNQQIFN